MRKLVVQNQVTLDGVFDEEEEWQRPFASSMAVDISSTTTCPTSLGISKSYEGESVDIEISSDDPSGDSTEYNSWE